MPRQYKYYDLVMAAFVCVLLCSNLIGAGKAAQLTLPVIGNVTFGADVFFFPISYIFGDVLTEVYGYGRDRRVVWVGFGALAFASLMAIVVVSLPPANSDYAREYQKHLVGVFGDTPRIAFASMFAYWCGSFSNSFVMAKMKIWTEGRFLWTRTIGSTLVGEFVDTGGFFFVAFYGIWPTWQIVTVMLTQYVCKVIWEVVMTPVTYRVVAFLKASEGEDYYDRNTDFNPFRLR
ncbi:MAG TPA: queuosine precursor transporter [Rhodocyclaceae bacterium]|jgi:uncharacterized integral membrane protein (TIGR00697 family)|nr:queuosine precursor transporter [Rhodocyclaceae bacterium]